MNFRPKPKGSPIPQNMGAVADEYSFTRQVRLAMEKMVEQVQERETELKDHMVRGIDKSRSEGGDTGASGQYYRVQIKDKEKPMCDDWPALFAYIGRSGRFDLLQKRLAVGPALELYTAAAAAKSKVPGLSHFFDPDVSVTKV